MKKIIIINITILITLFLLIEFSLRIVVNITPQGLSKGIIDENSSQPKFNFSNIKEGKVFGKNIYTDNKGFRITKDKSRKKILNAVKTKFSKSNIFRPKYCIVIRINVSYKIWKIVIKVV